MKLRHGLAATTVLLLTAGCQTPPPIEQLAGTTNWRPDTKHATLLTAEEAGGNGIEVGPPKIYDDASLRMMLNATRLKLASMSGLDQSSLIASLGSINGATISQSQFGFQVAGPSLPSTAMTNTGATSSTTTNGSLPSGQTTIPGTVTVTTDPTQSSTVTTTVAPPAAPTVSPGIAFTPPGSISASSLDILSQQMQLSSELTGLTLLLEGALSDRFVTNQHLVKPRVTLGFPISLRAPPQFKDAVAVVEIEVRTTQVNLADHGSPQPPAITALLPQEKTYNVAAMTDKMNSVGAGVVLGTVGLGASYLWGHKTFYLVQDQDTVALQRPAGADGDTTSFLWEFHPVLGQHYVRGGMKQTFVQLAFPVLEGDDCYGTIRVRTYWRRFDQDNGIVGDIIPESVLVSRKEFPVAHYDLTPKVGALDYEDLGDGTLAIHVRGQFLAGTYVQFGPARYEAGKNLLVEDTGVSFTAPAAAQAQWTGQIVARSGAAAPLLEPLAQQHDVPLQQTACVNTPDATGKDQCPDTSAKLPDTPARCPADDQLSIALARVTPLNETDSLLRVQLTTVLRLNPFLLAIGNKVFGLRDAPIRTGRSVDGPTLSVAVPTALLLANPRVRVFRPFYSDTDGYGLHCYDASYSLEDDFSPDSSAERLVWASSDVAGNATYVLYGNGLQHARVLVPDKGAAILKPLDSISSSRIQLLEVKKAALANTKKIVLQKENAEPPLLLDLPEAKAKATPPKISADSPIIQGTQELEVTAERAKQISSVKLKDKTLHWTPVDDSTIRLTALKSDGVTNEQRSCEITIGYKDGTKATLQLDVVAARVSIKTMASGQSSDTGSAQSK